MPRQVMLQVSTLKHSSAQLTDMLIMMLMHQVCLQSPCPTPVAPLLAGLRDEPEDVRVGRDRRHRNLRQDLPEEGELKRVETGHAGGKRGHDHDAGEVSLCLVVLNAWGSTVMTQQWCLLSCSTLHHVEQLRKHVTQHHNVNCIVVVCL